MEVMVFHLVSQAQPFLVLAVAVAAITATLED
jgi:hypothetical protein